MKKNFKLSFLIVISLFIVGFSWAQAATKNYLDKSIYTQTQLDSNLTVKWLFYLYYNIIWDWIAPSYKYIKLDFNNVETWSSIYDALQKWVYLDLIKNKAVEINLDANASEDIFNKMLSANFWETFAATPKKILTLWKFLDIMQELRNSDTQSQESTGSTNYAIENVKNFLILNDVYTKLKTNHYNSDSFKDEDLVNWAIKWMVEATWDKFSVYFPPVASKDFQDQLAWSFEWIWAQIDMSNSWVLTVIAPLPWSPAESAWLRWWDQITKINGVEITNKMTLEDAANKIKWPKWSTVTLTILRDWTTSDIKVIRDTIKLDYVTYKKLDNGDNYIQITTFWAGTYDAFSWVVDKISKENPNGKTIIDLRNDPGWSLDEVAKILNFFVPKWESTVNIKYKNYSTDMYSMWAPFNFLDKKIIVLINSWSASASEIMTATMKDYLTNLKVIWEKSYWKWSVQSLDWYPDWSSFKYTIAKWFSWKTKTGIDWVGIVPDIEVKLDEALFKNKVDNQLEYAKNLSF